MTSFVCGLYLDYLMIKSTTGSHSIFLFKETKVKNGVAGQRTPLKIIKKCMPRALTALSAHARGRGSAGGLVRSSGARAVAA